MAKERVMFEAHGAVEGNPTPQPIMEGGAIPEVSKPEVSAPQTPTPSPATPKAAPRGVPAPTPQAQPGAPAGEPAPYNPNYKFKVMDKEHEIPEWARASIKDAE